MLGHIPCFVVVWACECLLRGKVVGCVLFIGRILERSLKTLEFEGKTKMRSNPEQCTEAPYIVSIDMGSPKRGSFGWFGNQRRKGIDVDELLNLLLEKNYFAMGIEAPLFIPVRPDALKDFSGKRDFDSNHPWSAGAGACVTSINLGFLGSFLTRIHQENTDIAITTDFDAWKACKDNCILIWESFISGKSGASRKENGHLGDAGKALRLFEAGKFQKLSPEAYLNLPLAIGKEIGMKTLPSSTMLVVKGEK